MFLNNPLNVQQLIGFCLILFGGTLFLIKPVFGTRTRVQENALIGILLLCSILATAYYLNFGQLRVFGKYGAQNYHPEEIFGQYIGSKYFRETGYYDLYACASVAIQEMKAETPRQPTPNLFTINDLTGKQYLLTPSEVMAQYQGQCHDRFSGERWKEFKGDLRTMFDINMSDFWWRVTLSDVGYSSSPVYSTIIGKIANLLPLSHCWKWLGYIDIFLYALSAFFIWRTFGLYPLIGLLLIFGTNELSNYAWTAGSFFRATWFTCLAIALCLLKNKKFFWAGVLFAAASADRGFPLLFFIGALAPLANDWFESRGQKKEAYSLVKGFFITGCILFLLPIVVYGPGAWRDFFAHMAMYNHHILTNKVGLINMFFYHHGYTGQNFWWDAGRLRFEKWNAECWAVFNSRKWIYYSLAGLTTIAVLFTARKKSPALAAMLVGGTLLFVLLSGLQYYYIYLALFPVVAWALPSNLYTNVRLSLIFVLIFSFKIIPILIADGLMQFMYFSYALAAFFLLQVLIGLAEEAFPLQGTEKP